MGDRVQFDISYNPEVNKKWFVIPEIGMIKKKGAVTHVEVVEEGIYDKNNTGHHKQFFVIEGFTVGVERLVFLYSETYEEIEKEIEAGTFNPQR